MVFVSAYNERTCVRVCVFWPTCLRQGKLLNALQCTEVAFAKQWREPFVELALEAGRGVQTLDQVCLGLFLQRVFFFFKWNGPKTSKKQKLSFFYFFRVLKSTRLSTASTCAPSPPPQALQRYFAPETLEGPNAYKAPGIAAKQRAVKRVYLDQPPEVTSMLARACVWRVCRGG